MGGGDKGVGKLSGYAVLSRAKSHGVTWFPLKAMAFSEDIDSSAVHLNSNSCGFTRTCQL